MSNAAACAYGQGLALAMDTDASAWAKTVARGRSRAEILALARDKHHSARRSLELAEEMSKNQSNRQDRQMVSSTWKRDAAWHKAGAEELDRIAAAM